MQTENNKDKSTTDEDRTVKSIPAEDTQTENTSSEKPQAENTPTKSPLPRADVRRTEGSTTLADNTNPLTKPYIRYNVNNKKFARTMRKEMTPAEKVLWYQYLRHHRYKFTRQKPLGNYIADFYSSKLQLVIEADGAQHYTEAGMHYDAKRTEFLDGLLLTVLRFPNADVLQNFRGVVTVIEKYIERREKEKLL